MSIALFWPEVLDDSLNATWRNAQLTRTSFRDASKLCRFNVFTFSIDPLVRIILGRADGLDKLIEPLSRKD